MAQANIKAVITAEDRASSTLSSFGDNAQRVAKIASVAFVTAAAAATVFAVKSAADYEQSLNVFRSVSGATASDMLNVAAAARTLGKDVTLPGVSAKDAALAMVELAKAGLSVNDTLAASKGVLSLAKAGQLETAEAALVTANALNAFGLKGKEASRVADLLAAAANASSASVGDLAFGLQMSSASAAAVKVPVEDLTTLLAAMANNGIKGSDAGTSLKTMFMNLIPTTDKAISSMQQLNLDFYDAQGSFVGTRNLIKQLQEGTRGLTDEQKALHVENIFGADSSRAANVLIKEGVEGYDKLSKAVNKTGAATELAAAQNAGFNGAMDSLRSSLETVAIDLGMKLLPSLTGVAKTLADKVEPSFNKFTDVAKKVGNFLEPAVKGLGDTLRGDLLPALKSAATSDFVKIMGGSLVVAVNGATIALTGVIRVGSGFVSFASQSTGILVGLTAGFVAYKSITTATAIATTAMAVAQGALNAVMLLNPLALVAAAAIGITAAYFAVTTQTNSTKTATDNLRIAQDFLRQTTDAAKAAQDRLTGAMRSEEGAALAVERAQRNFTAAVAQYGPKSLEAREASFQLKSANDQLAQANAAVRDRTNEAAAAEVKKKNAKDAVIAAHDQIANSAYNAAGGYQALAEAISKADAEDRKSGFSGAKGAGPKGAKATFSIPGRAVGGPVKAGSPYVVGEQGPELFLPEKSGTIVPNRQTSKIMGQGMPGGQTIINVTLSGVFTSSQIEMRKLAEMVFQAKADSLSMGGASL